MAVRRPRNASSTTPSPSLVQSNLAQSNLGPSNLGQSNLGQSNLATPAVATPDGVKPSPLAGAAATFAGLGVPAKLVELLAANGVVTPSAIQAASLADSLAGRDVLGRARTGSGKTYAFALPVLVRLAASKAARRPGRPRALILAPTRELATQIEAAMAPLARALSLRTLTIFGGVGAGPQISGLRAGVDILVACPGRLTDHVQSGHAHLDAVEITVLDEADHMADLGFLPVVRRLLDLTPSTGQRLLFSATLDASVEVLVRRFLTNPITHSVDSAQSPVVEMSHHVLQVRRDDRIPILVDLAAAPGRSLVFTRTKRGAKTLTRQLVAAGVPAVELHGNLAQNARNRNLSAFAEGTVSTMVATDIAARGIHVDDVALIIHADPPVEHKAYLHRSGRTARAGARGTVVTITTDDQMSDVRDLTRKAGINPTVTRLNQGDPLLAKLAPGERTYRMMPPQPEEAASARAPRSRSIHLAGPRSSSAPRTIGSSAGGARSAGATGRSAGTAVRSAGTAGRSAGAAAFSAKARGGVRGSGR